MKVLVTGGNGQLGRCLQDRLKKSTYEWIAVDKDALDITSSTDVQAFFGTYQPDIVVNAAAYTAVDKAEADEAAAIAVNTDASRILAENCKDVHIPLIHISTDYVFDGSATTPYKPCDTTNPQSVYGRTKLAGELAIQSLLDEYLIIRTAWVFSEYGNNFVKTMCRLAQTRSELGVVADQFGCPTYAGHLADAIMAALVKINQGGSCWGIYHYCGDKATSWYGFSQAIFEAAYDRGLITAKPTVHQLSTSEYPTAATRPSYSVLDCSSLDEQLGIKCGNWNSALAVVLETIKNIFE